MTPLRHVTIQPFLLEVLATPLAPSPIFDETVGPSGGWTRTITPISYDETLLRISKQGFRFPTSDEWEYACAAGSRALFRWGNMTPPHAIPLLGTEESDRMGYASAPKCLWAVHCSPSLSLGVLRRTRVHAWRGWRPYPTYRSRNIRCMADPRFCFLPAME